MCCAGSFFLVSHLGQTVVSHPDQTEEWRVFISRSHVSVEESALDVGKETIQ